jgi:hypothetical protein
MSERMTATEAYGLALGMAPNSVAMAVLDTMDIDELRILAGLLSVALQAKYDTTSRDQQIATLEAIDASRWTRRDG